MIAAARLRFDESRSAGRADKGGRQLPNETCTVSTGGGTRRVRLVREVGGGGPFPRGGRASNVRRTRAQVSMPHAALDLFLQPARAVVDNRIFLS